MKRVSRKNIDLDKWEACVQSAATWRNPLYGHAWFLDITAQGDWHGLVWGDYEAVAPICTNRKLGFSQVYRPTITQQLGIFCSALPTTAMKEDLRDTLLQYRRCVYSLPIPSWPSVHSHHRRSNYQLDLAPFDSAIKSIKSKSQRQRIRRGMEHLDLQLTHNATEHVELVGQMLQEKYRLSTQEEAVFTRLGHHLLANKSGYIIQATDPSGDILSSSLVAEANGYATLLLGGSSSAGRQVHARSLLIYHTIKRALQKGFIAVDFEGSDLPGVAKYFGSFGATDVGYLDVRHDQMPYLIKKLRPL